MSTSTLSEPRAQPRRRPAPATRLEPSPRRSAHLVLVSLGLATILSIFALRCLKVARADAITSDETTHLTHCLHYWMTGDDLAMWELGAPRLPHYLASYASYRALAAGNLLPATPSVESITRLVLSGALRVTFPARCLAVGSGLVLIAAAFWSVARLRGPIAGLLAAFLLSVVPEVLAHSSIAGSDMPFTAAAFLAVVMLARYVERPSRGRWIAVAFVVGLAWAMRHTALLLVILAGGVELIRVLRRPSIDPSKRLLDRLRTAIVSGFILLVVSFGVLWAGDGFTTVSVADVSQRVTARPVPTRIGPIDVSQLRVPTSALSILKQVRHQNQGHEAYLCGAYRQDGWTLYFPVAFLLKTPVGWLGLFALALARLRPKYTFEYLCLAAMALLWLILVRNKVNIGVRYALLTYPLAVPFLIRLLEPGAWRDRVRFSMTCACLGWLLWASFSSEGRFLSYFNELGGGARQGWLYLADSNLDWGQDFDRLGPVLTHEGIHEVTTDISSERNLEVPGIFAVRNPSEAHQVHALTPANRRLYDSEGGYLPVYTRYVAVSASRLLGLYSQNDMSWLRSRKLVARAGDSILVFDMDTPADRPLWE